MAKLRCIGGSNHGASVNVPDGAIDMRSPLPPRRVIGRTSAGYIRGEDELYRSRKLTISGPFFSYTETVMVLSSVDEKTAREQLAGMGICPNVDTLHQPQVKTPASSAIRSVGYNTKAEELDVVLESGAYRYSDVNMAIVMEFLAAPSKGQFFQRVIKGKFACRKLAL